jgi:hypothetical protein
MLRHVIYSALVIELAALLHDVLDKKYVSEAEAADAHAYFVWSLSLEHGLDLISDGQARQITKVIEDVSWTTEKKLRDTGKIEEQRNTCVHSKLQMLQVKACIMNVVRKTLMGSPTPMAVSGKRALSSRKLKCTFSLGKLVQEYNGCGSLQTSIHTFPRKPVTCHV